MTDSKKRSGKKGVKSESGGQSATERCKRGGKQRFFFPQPRLARLTLRDGRERDVEKIKRRRPRGGSVRRWMEGWGGA